MLRDIPSHVGIRFVRTPGAPVTRTADGLARTQRANAGGFTLRNPRVTLNTNETAVIWTDAASPSAVEIESKTSGITLRPFDVKLRASAADRLYLIAAAEAVLAQGVPVAAASGTRNSATLIIGATSSDSAKPLLAPWQVEAARAIATDTSLTRAAGSATITSNPSNGSAPWIVLMRDAGGKPAILAAADGATGATRMLVWSRLAASDEATALLIRATLRALAGGDGFGEAEVMAIPDSTLARWQRPSSEPPASEWRNVDGNDRRWLWGVVIALLVAEQVLRQRARHVEAQADRKVFENAA
jgi:hypothetical protein